MKLYARFLRKAPDKVRLFFHDNDFSRFLKEVKEAKEFLDSAKGVLVMPGVVKACDFADTAITAGKGMVILNHECGKRIGFAAKLADTYKGVGDFFKKKCTGYTGYIFTGNLALSKKVGLQTKKRIPFYNGDIECRLLEYDIY